MRSRESPPSDPDYAETSLTNRRYAAVALAVALPLAVLIVLYLLDMPMGQPHLKYRFSPVASLRVGSAGIAVLLGIGSLAAIVALATGPRRRPAAIAAVVALGWIALVAWTYFAPPQHGQQHLINMLSPSHDGAFLLESTRVDSIREYASKGFYDRLRLKPQAMHGRRILSNPPGMTFTALLCRRVIHAYPALRKLLSDAYGLENLDDPNQEVVFSSALLLAMWLTGVWGVSLLFSYKLCRLWLPPAAALAVGLACVFNPATVEFTPGKDPAQVTLVVLLLLCWMHAYLGKGRRWGVVAGVVLAISLTIGLIFVWIAAIAAVATLWDALARRGGLRTWLADCALPAAIGAVVVASALYVSFDWNVALMTYRIAVRYPEIQVGVIADPFYLTFLGLLMFLLFVGPMFWAQLALTEGRYDRPAGALPGRLLLCTLAVMAFSYFFANNNETPRLWIPFIPLLLIPLAARRSVFVHESAGNRKLLVCLVALQLVGTTLHWSLMDVRESEYRLITGRLWE